MKKTAIALGLSTLLAASLTTGASARSGPPLKGEGKGLKLIANVPTGSGTDAEFATIKGHDYGFVTSRSVDNAPGGLNVVNVDNPAKPKLVAKLGCNLNQGDVQISHDQKTVIMAADAAGGPDACLMLGKAGFMTIDISNPLKPQAVGVAQIPRGSHNVTAHPKAPYVYNSDSDGGTSRGEIQIWSIKNPAKPKLVDTIINPPHSPHDVSFNKDGSRLVTAARSAIHLYDTTDPEKPVLLGAAACPGCQLAHDAKFTPDSKWVIAGDEANGGGAYACPGGALYFFEVVADRALLLRGVYEPGEVVFATEGQGSIASCTSHVFDISPDGKKLAISWYSAGTRYLDISNMTGATFGENGNGVKELGWFIPVGSSSWSSKFHKGPYIYSNDINRGLDIYKITAK